MLSIIAQIVCCLILAALLGFVIGWLLRGTSKDESSAQALVPSAAEKQNLENRIRELQEENQRLAAALEACKKPAAETLPKDDLKKIKGIGLYLEKKLHALGVYSYRQIATWSEQDIQKIVSELEYFHDRIRRDKWVAQAKRLHQEKYGEEM